MACKQFRCYNLNGRMNYRETYRNSQDQQNYPLNINYNTKRDKKYSYQPPQIQRNSPNPNELDQLRRQLKEQRQKVKALEARTIQEQSIVLKHLEVLQGKFHDLASEKESLEAQLTKMKAQNQWRNKYQQLEEEYRHVKGIADSMIDMMRKSQGSQGDLHQAWRWVKRVVWQHQSIRKKALQWKEVYDQVTTAVSIIEKQAP